MLQLTTPSTHFNDARLQPGAIAFCPETGANLIRSNQTGCYILFFTLRRYRKWERDDPLSSDEAIARAQPILDDFFSERRKQAGVHTRMEHLNKTIIDQSYHPPLSNATYPCQCGAQGKQLSLHRTVYDQDGQHILMLAALCECHSEAHKDALNKSYVWFHHLSTNFLEIEQGASH